MKQLVVQIQNIRLNDILFEKDKNKSSCYFLSLFHDKHFLQHIVTEKTRYASQKKLVDIDKNSRLKAWFGTNRDEFHRFLKSSYGWDFSSFLNSLTIGVGKELQKQNFFHNICQQI